MKALLPRRVPVWHGNSTAAAFRWNRDTTTLKARRTSWASPVHSRLRVVSGVDEVADLKDAYPARIQVCHVLSREPQEVALFSGRLDADRLRVDRRGHIRRLLGWCRPRAHRQDLPVLR